MTHSNRPAAGILWFMLHCLFFSGVSIVFKLLLQQGFTVYQIVTVKVAVSLLCLLPWLLVKKRARLDTRVWPLYLLRSALWLAATGTFFYALTRIPIPQATALSFAVPLFNTVFAMLILKERVGRHRLLALVAGCAGMMIIVRPGLDFNMASLWVAFASLCWSLNDIIVKIIAKTQPVVLQSVVFLGVSTALSLPFAWHHWIEPTLPQWGLLVLVGVFYVVALIALLQAYHGSDLNFLMPFYFVQLLFVSGLAYLLFDEAVTQATLIGAVVILASGTYIAYRERRGVAPMA